MRQCPHATPCGRSLGLSLRDDDDGHRAALMSPGTGFAGPSTLTSLRPVPVVIVQPPAAACLVMARQEQQCLSLALASSAERSQGGGVRNAHPEDMSAAGPANAKPQSTNSHSAQDSRQPNSPHTSGDDARRRNARPDLLSPVTVRASAQTRSRDSPCQIRHVAMPSSASSSHASQYFVRTYVPCRP